MQYQTDTARSYLSNFLHQVANGLPRFLGFLVILLISYIVAKVLAVILFKALEAARLNQHLHAGKGGNLIQRALPDPASVLSKLGFWLIFLFGLSIAVSSLGIPALEQIVHGIYAYLPNVIAALLIFLVAGAVAGGVSTLVANAMGDTATGKIMASGAPVLVMGLATFMILNQLKIAPAIVTITYAGLVGTATLAFGLGGKDAASKMFLSLYEAGQQKKDMAASDLQKGATRAKAKADDLRDNI